MPASFVTVRNIIFVGRIDKHEIENVIGVWQKQYKEFAERNGINHVLIFENKGEAVGVSNPHPHGQIYATNFVFKTIETEANAAAKHFKETGRGLI